MKFDDYHWFDAVAFAACLLIACAQSVLLQM